MSDKSRVSTTHTGLTPDTKYIARVRSFDKLGNPTEWADAVVFTTPSIDENIYIPDDNSAPATPANVVIKTAFKAVRVSWDPNTEIDMVNGYGKYIVQLDFTGHFLFPREYETTDPHLVDVNSEFTPGLPLFTRVRAEDAHGNQSDWSSVVMDTLLWNDTEDLVSDLVLEPGQSISSANWDGMGQIDLDDPNSIGTQGFRFQADGVGVLTDALIRGVVEADTFRTRPDFTTGGGIEINTTDVGANVILFRRPGTLEATPAHLLSDVDSATPAYNSLEMKGPGSDTTSPYLWLGHHIASQTPYISMASKNSSNGSGDIKIEAGPTSGVVRLLAQDVTLNHVSIMRPPLFIGSGSSDLNPPEGHYSTISSGDSWSKLNHTVVFVQNGYKVTGGGLPRFGIPSTGAALNYNAGTQRYTPGVAGVWSITASYWWFPTGGGGFVAHMGFDYISINTGLVTDYEAGGLIGTKSQCSIMLPFNGTTDYVSPVVQQFSGTNQKCLLFRLTFKWESALP